MKTNKKSRNILVRMIQNFIIKLSQHPEFYNTSYNKRTHHNNRHGHIVW